MPNKLGKPLYRELSNWSNDITHAPYEFAIEVLLERKIESDLSLVFELKNFLRSLLPPNAREVHHATTEAPQHDG